MCFVSTTHYGDILSGPEWIMLISVNFNRNTNIVGTSEGCRVVVHKARPVTLNSASKVLYFGNRRWFVVWHVTCGLWRKRGLILIVCCMYSKICEALELSFHIFSFTVYPYSYICNFANYILQNYSIYTKSQTVTFIK